MSGEAIGWAFRKVQMDDPTTKLVLVALCNHANHEDQAWPSHFALCQTTGLSKRTVQISIKKLEAWGLITRVPRTREDGSDTSAMVYIDIDSGWTIKDGVAVRAGDASHASLRVQEVQGVGAPHAPLETTLKPQEEIGRELPLGAAAPAGDLEKQFFDRAVQIITSSQKNARSTAASLRKACGMDIAKARSVLELAAGKSDPAHWIRGHIAWLQRKAAEPSDNTVFMNNADDSRVLL